MSITHNGSISGAAASHTGSMSPAGTYPAVRLAGSCGVASAALLLAVPALPVPDRIAGAVWLLGFVLLLPFFAGITWLTRTTGDRRTWWSPAIPAAAAALVAVQLTHMAVEYVANSMSKSSPVHEPLHALGGGLFTVAMLPLGVAIVCSAAAGLVGRVLPQWLAWLGLAVGLTGLINGTMLGSESAWGFLLGIVWVLASGLVLAVRGAKASVAPDPATIANPGREGRAHQVTTR